MATFFANHFVGQIGPDLDGNQVAHAAGRNKEGRFFAEDFGSAFLQEIDGGIFAINIVSHFSGGHGPAHFVAGARDGIAAQIDSVLHRRDAIGIHELITFSDGVLIWLSPVANACLRHRLME